MPSIGIEGTYGYYKTGEIQEGCVSYRAESQKRTNTFGRVTDKVYEKDTLEGLVKHLIRYKMLHRVEIFGMLPDGTCEALFYGFNSLDV